MTSREHTNGYVRSGGCSRLFSASLLQAFNTQLQRQGHLFCHDSWQLAAASMNNLPPLEPNLLRKAISAMSDESTCRPSQRHGTCGHHGTRSSQLPTTSLLCCKAAGSWNRGGSQRHLFSSFHFSREKLQQSCLVWVIFPCFFGVLKFFF